MAKSLAAAPNNHVFAVGTLASETARLTNATTSRTPDARRTHAFGPHAEVKQVFVQESQCETASFSRRRGPTSHWSISTQAPEKGEEARTRVEN